MTQKMKRKPAKKKYRKPKYFEIPLDPQAAVLGVCSQSLGLGQVFMETPGTTECTAYTSPGTQRTINCAQSVRGVSTATTGGSNITSIYDNNDAPS